MRLALSSLRAKRSNPEPVSGVVWIASSLALLAITAKKMAGIAPGHLFFVRSAF
jgi:hypothetical protein